MFCISQTVVLPSKNPSKGISQRHHRRGSSKRTAWEADIRQQICGEMEMGCRTDMTIKMVDNVHSLKFSLANDVRRLAVRNLRLDIKSRFYISDVGTKLTANLLNVE